MTTQAQRPAAGAKSGRTRQRLLDATARTLSVKGYGGTRLLDVAEEAEVRAPAIYYHFESRDDLIEQVMWVGIADMRRHLVQVMAQAPDDLDSLERILLAVDTHLRHMLAVSDYATASIRNSGQLPAHLDQRRREETRRYEALWRDLFVDAARAGAIRSDIDVTLAQRLITGALCWAAEWWSPALGSLDVVVATAQSIVRAGLRPPAASSGSMRTSGAAPTAPPTPGAEQEGDTRRRILAAAAAVMCHRGYAMTRIFEIARVAQVRPPAVYHYFPSREELLSAVVQEGQQLVRAHVDVALAELPSDAGSAQRLAAAVAAHLQIELTLSDFAKAVIRNAGHLPSGISATVARDGDRYHRIWRDLIDDAAAEGLLRPGIDAHAGRMLVIGALNWAAEWWRPTMPIEDVVTAAQALVVDGLLVAD